MLSERYDDALVFAHSLHRAQTRKATDIPYIGHLLATSALVIDFGGDEDAAIAALLHDAVEDQGGAPTLDAIRTRFGDGVAGIVADCTDSLIQPKPPWRARKQAFIDCLPEKPAASLLVILADKTHNAESIVADHAVVGELVWERFKAGRDGTRWYYSAIAEALARLIPGPKTGRLHRAVAAFPDA